MRKGKERKCKWHPGEEHYSGDLEFEDDILDSFGKDYEIRRGDIGKLDDSDLVNKIRRFYNKFYRYKEVQKKSVEFYRVYKFNFGYYPGGNPLREREKLEEELVKEAQELEIRLDKRCQ